MAKKLESRPPDHLSGKRRWMRQPIVIEAVCVGAGATVRGKTIDVSRGGMLFEAHDGDIPPVGDGDLVPLAFLVAAVFAQGMKAKLGPKVSVLADVIRVTTSPLDRNFLRLGCQFRTPLTRRQCAKLRIDESDVPDPSLDLGPQSLDGMEDSAEAGEVLEVTARPDRRRMARSAAPSENRRAPTR